MPHSRRQPARLTFGLLLAGIAGAWGCAAGETDGPPIPSPLLTVADSVVLADTGSFALGDLAHASLHVGDDAFWVGDRQNARIVRFGRDGRVLGQIGRKGRGPGEIGGAGPFVPLADGSIAMWDYGNGRLAAYDAGRGTLRWEAPVPGMLFPMQIQAVGDTLWIGVVSVRDGTGAMRLVAGQSRLDRLAPVPAEYREGLGHSLPYSVALRFGDTLFVGYGGHHRVFLHHDDGRVDSLVVPRRRRRGVPVDLLQQARAGLATRTDGKGLENYVSTLMRGARLSDGSVALVYYDVEFDQGGGTPASVDTWITVVDPAFARACVDARLRLSERSLPSLAFRGDTLFALEHVITGSETVPVLRAIVISTAGCDWLPVARE
jgi:hypothetical protein